MRVPLAGQPGAPNKPEAPASMRWAHLAQRVNVARLGPNNVHGLGAFVEHHQLQYTSLSGGGDADPDAFILETFVAAVWGNHGVLIAKVIRRAAATETDTDDHVPQPAYMRRTKLREHHTFSLSYGECFPR